MYVYIHGFFLTNFIPRSLLLFVFLSPASWSRIYSFFWPFFYKFNYVLAKAQSIEPNQPNFVFDKNQLFQKCFVGS